MPARPVRPLLLLAVLLFASASGAQVDSPASGSPALEVDVGTDTVMDLDDVPEPDPCAMERGVELLGLDWSRRQLHHGICATVRWFDGFFGDQRFDEAARKIRGRVAYSIEHRDRVGVDAKLRLRLRVTTPNLSQRLNFYVEREDARATLLERTDAEADTQVVQPASTAQSDAVRVGFGYDGIKNDHESLDLRTSLRVREGKLAPSTRIRYWREFLRTDISQWRFTEEVFWRSHEGWGETTALDYEFKISTPNLVRWFNEGTWSQSTQGWSWRTGIGLYRSLGSGKAGLVEFGVSGQTDAPVSIANYGTRVAYRQTLGRTWLLGEVYSGYDWPKSQPEDIRHSQLYGGLSIEVLFGHQ